MGKRKRGARERRQWERMLRGAVVGFEKPPELGEELFIDGGCPDPECPVCQAIRECGAPMVDCGVIPGFGTWTARRLSPEQAEAVRKVMEPLDLWNGAGVRARRNGAKADA